ncbi:UBA/TS-N domain protein [Teladorsagia circumcincta]|uniref:UBA/TS-N domain protein n=1 Tax=Teladorsagia circumcincta TaxID=45464 RepID=A0A2G9UY16_TELCI|nr:UBA/TS-N domain protein [Teladorsagia circumcincta]
MNQKWEWAKCQEDGASLENIFGPGYTGLINIGSSCYMNSENSTMNGIKPSQFKRVVAGNHPEFSSSRQQDAEEYVRFKMESRFEDIASTMVRYTDREETVLAVPVPKAAIRAGDGEGQRSAVALTDCLHALFEPETIEDFVSPITKEKRGARTTVRFKTFPDFLFLQAQRFTMSPDFTVKKLDIDLQVPDEIDLSGLRGIGKKENETLLPDDATASPAPALPDYDRSIAEQTGRSGGVEAAAEWVMLRLDDPSLNDPPAVPAGGRPASAGPASMEGLNELVAFGFTPHQARYALSRNPDANAAAEWLFVHAEEIPPECGAAVPGENTTPLEPAMSREFSDGSGKYRLVAFISHMGNSPHSGHYVAHVKKEDRWILFNDEKVAISQNPPRQLAYLYLFQRAE